MQLSQICTKIIQGGNISVHAYANDYKVGEIDIKKKVFYSSPRSSKNIMKLFEGLGLNEELLVLLLPSLGIETIKVLFNNKVLTTSRSKWIRKGILNPYCDINIDKQIILKLSDINMDPFENTVVPLFENSMNKSSEPNLFNNNRQI